MPCYPLKNTSEQIITTLGSKPCTFQNSSEFWPNSPYLFLFFYFFLFPSPTRLRRHPSRLFFLPLSYSSCLIHLDKEWGGARGKYFKDLHSTPLSHPSHPLPPINVEPPPRCTLEPHRPVPAQPQPLSLSLETRGHLELTLADQGTGDKPAPATTPPAGLSHCRHYPTACCRPRRPLAIP
jgi:hypothetical protein